MTAGDREVTDALTGAVQRYLDESGIAWELGGRDGELVLTLPGEQKLKTVCSLVLSDDALSLSAFVVRNPDENHEAVYRFLLQRNLRMPGLSYAIDAAGDVYVTGRIPVPVPGSSGDGAAPQREASDPAYGTGLVSLLDQLLGVVLSAADGAFNELLTLGFLTSMRKEWAWRVSRGESTRNLDAFRHLLDPSPAPAPGLSQGEGGVERQ